MKPIEIVSLNFFILASITIVVYYVLTPRLQPVWLLVVSYFFYATWNWRYVAILLGFTIFNFFIAQQIGRSKSAWLLWLSVIVNAASLILLKLLTGPYALSLLNPATLEVLTAILIPVGFSFYILQVISYLTDVYRGQIQAEDDFIYFALYLAYFPKMISGPIERAKNFLPQLKRERIVNQESIEQGLYLILLGLLRKVVIADHLSALLPTDIFSKLENHTSLDRVIWLLIFAFIIYNDFAGYTSIVRGVSCFLGIQLTPNFRQPFFARSFSDFWTRWHITLSEWLRDYIFFPIRRWLMKIGSPLWMALIIPSLSTMLVSGFWHRASFALLLWGFLHGLYLVVEQVLQQVKLFPKARYSSFIYPGLVFCLITLAWIPFNTASVRAAIRYGVNLLPPFSTKVNLLILPDLLLFPLFSLWLDWQEQKHDDLSFPRKWSATQQSWSVAVAVILLFLFSHARTDLSTFIYQFF
jgi:alginate O-acetyltransferase complex protein AlgI